MKYMDDLLAKQAYIQQNMPKKDPFDQGISRAVRSAKQSLDMDDEQSDRAMRESMATFAENIAPMPKARGFMANFAQVGRALSPAIRTHDQYEDDAKEKNKQMIAYAQQLRAAEEAKAASLEAAAYSREMADKQMEFQQQQLDEQRNYHAQSLEAARAKAEAKIAGTPPIYAKDLIKNNLKFLEKKREQNITDNALIATLDDLENAIHEANLQGQVGSDLSAIRNRAFGKYITGNNKAVNLADAAKYAYFGRIKEAGGANPSTLEMTEALKTIPSVEKNPQAALEQLAIDRNNAKKRIADYNLIKQNMEANGYQGSPDDYLNDNAKLADYYTDNWNVVTDNNIEKQHNGFVQMAGPKGSIEVPIDRVDFFIQNGYR